MFCKECGHEINDKAVMCVNCGCETKKNYGQTKTRAIYILLALFLGCFGIHNFYAGYHNKGVIQLLVTVFLGWLIIPWLIIAMWAFIECFIVTEDANGNLLE